MVKWVWWGKNRFLCVELRWRTWRKLLTTDLIPILLHHWSSVRRSWLDITDQPLCWYLFSLFVCSPSHLWRITSCAAGRSGQRECFYLTANGKAFLIYHRLGMFQFQSIEQIWTSQTFSCCFSVLLLNLNRTEKSIEVEYSAQSESFMSSINEIKCKTNIYLYYNIVDYYLNSHDKLPTGQSVSVFRFGVEMVQVEHRYVCICTVYVCY